MDKKVTIPAGSWIENEQEISDNFILKNCQFIEGQRGLIIKAGGLVENCLVQGRPIALRAGPELHWLESGYIHDLTFKNVTFKECGFDKAHVDDRGIFGAGLFGEHDAVKSRNQNVTFEGCTFDNNYGIQLYISESQNVSVKDCTFIEGTNSTQQIYIENLDGITLSGNKFEGSIPKIEQGDNVKNYKEN